MKLGSFLAAVLGIAFAAMLHLAFLLFGGLLFMSHKKDHGTLQVVELVSEDDAKEDEEKPEEATSEATDELEAETEEAPDAAEVIRNLEQPAAALAPALEAASLSAIEAALSGQGGGGGDFAEALSFQSGGRIGGMGKASTLEEKFDTAFSLSEMDQKPRAIFQATPVYPAAMRGKEIEGVVSVIFIVDPAGKVASPRIKKSSHTAFNEPALDAVKQWKFEPGVKGGQRAACRMLVEIRFPLS